MNGEEKDALQKVGLQKKRNPVVVLVTSEAFVTCLGELGLVCIEAQFCKQIITHFATVFKMYAHACCSFFRSAFVARLAA